MNKKPVSYKQIDSRWSRLPYRVKGENSTIGGSGCGPTCAAMLIETLTGRKTTPVDTCNWAVQHGYKALNQGTYYSYFKPQFAAYGIACDMLNWQDSYHNPYHSNHDKIVQMLTQGYYVIALMKEGLWTSSGHFVVVWWSDNHVHILDPASYNPARLEGKLSQFRNEVKYYWWIDARAYNKPTVLVKPSDIIEKEEDNMTGEEIYKSMREYLRTQPIPEWAKEEYQKAIDAGITDGTNPMDLIPRYQAALMAYRASQKK